MFVEPVLPVLNEGLSIGKAEVEGLGWIRSAHPVAGEACPCQPEGLLSIELRVRVRNYKTPGSFIINFRCDAERSGAARPATRCWVV